MEDAQRLVVAGLGFGLVVGAMALIEAWLYAGPSAVGAWAGRLPEAAAILVVGMLGAIAVAPATGARAAVYVILLASAVALFRARLPEARRALTPMRTGLLLVVGALGLALCVGVAFGGSQVP